MQLAPNSPSKRHFRAPLFLALLASLAAAPPITSQSTTAPALPTAPPASPAKLDAARLVVAGDVTTPLSLSLADLAALPRKILTVTNEHEKKQEIYQGVPLAEILKRAGVPQGTELRGPALATYVRVDAADGYSVVFGLAELDSSVTDSDVLVADTLDGSPLPDKIGPLRLIVPHDRRPARWVRMLRTITVVKPSK
jgi:DMSO/TMAO reductase YedYZ molybdopterin-dependent catalytic subunit